MLRDAYRQAFAKLAKVELPKEAIKERMNRNQIRKVVERVVSEHAKDFVWGVKSPGRVANQYSLKKLKMLVKEAKENAAYEQPEYTDYEVDDMDTDRQMVVFLGEILAQLKVLNYHMTPAKQLGPSGAEKAAAGLAVAEGKKSEN